MRTTAGAVDTADLALRVGLRGFSHGVGRMRERVRPAGPRIGSMGGRVRGSHGRGWWLDIRIWPLDPCILPENPCMGSPAPGRRVRISPTAAEERARQKFDKSDIRGGVYDAGSLRGFPG